ncbi:hypothetical protein TNCV_384521 [Trichonephila clavipes]|nr:hypothetical protein TNCV_384521 [Trichonephila clavipes]
MGYANELSFLLCFVPENQQNQKEHDTRMGNFRPWTPLEKFLRALLAVIIQRSSIRRIDIPGENDITAR